jgi:hypothetical protein
MPGAESPPADQSTEAAGFRTAYQPSTALHIEVWGYWTTDVAAAFTREALPLAAKLGASTAVLLDAKALKPQGTEGQDALRVLFRALSTGSFGKATLATDNVLTRMQLTRLLRECGLDGRVGFE